MIRAGVALFLGWLGGCGGDANGADGGVDERPSSCPNDLPASCAMPAPSYMTTIAPLVQLRCLGCHSAGNVESSRPLDTYNNIYAIRTTVLTQIYGCQMPPAGAPTLDSTERQEMLSWLVCQAPNN